MINRDFVNSIIMFTKLHWEHAIIGFSKCVITIKNEILFILMIGIVTTFTK